MIWADIYKNISYGDRWIQLMEFGEAFWCGWSGNKGGGWGFVRYFIFDLCLGCQGKLYVSDKDVNKIIWMLKYANDFWKI